jgi:hypothetical protein
MKIIISSFLIFIFLSNPSFAKWGKGDLKLDKETMETVIMYMYGAGSKKYSGNVKRKNNPTTMAISQNGKWSMYMYCPVEYHDGCVATNIAQLIKACEKDSNGSPCFIFAKYRRIVWKNGGQKTTIKRKDLKDPYLVAKKIKEAGFYDGDISKLAGIDVKTGQIDEQTNIVGKLDKYDYPSLIAMQKTAHKDNWKDYVEGGSEKYKAWVMAISKTKNDMGFGWEANNTSWSDVIKKSFDRCNKYIKQNPRGYPKESICILYYKGTKPTSDKEKIETAIKYYDKTKVENFFKRYSYILIDQNNSLLKESKVSKKTSQTDDIVSKLKDLKDLLDSGAITQDEFQKAKEKILN